MTVIVAYKHNNIYYLTGDGRTTSDDYSIITDGSIKVRRYKKYIVGFCGTAGDELPILEAVQQVQEPFLLLKLLASEEFKGLFNSFSLFVIHSKYGGYSIDKEEDDKDKIEICSITRFHDSELPQLIGSGSKVTKAIIEATYDEKKGYSHEFIEACVKAAYKTNTSIGGLITTVSIKRG